MKDRMFRNEEGRLVNMYDCTACPRCEGEYRYPFRGEVVCDDCGHSERWTLENGKPKEEAP